MQPVIVNLLITYAWDHFHTPREQGGAMDPAGGFANPCPGLLALRWSITICRGLRGICIPCGLKPPAVVATVDPPFITEPGDILAGGFARLT